MFMRCKLKGHGSDIKNKGVANKWKKYHKNRIKVHYKVSTYVHQVVGYG